MRRAGSTALLFGVVAFTTMTAPAQAGPYYPTTPGDALGAVALSASAAPAPPGRYTVSAGDTLSSIATRNGTSVQALAAANGIANPNHIVIGQVLALTTGGTSTSNPGTVVVQPGETLGFDELIAFLRGQGIASFKLPERLVVVPEMPLTPTRKIIKGKLKLPA